MRSLSKFLSVYCNKNFGINLSNSKIENITKKIVERIVEKKYHSSEEYFKILSQKSSYEERIFFISMVTTNVTQFFRESHHFDYMKDFLKNSSDHLKQSSQFNVWSTACSSGEEAYSAAMIAEVYRQKIPNWDFKILGTDVDYEMINKARKGEYSNQNISSIPKDLFSKFCKNNYKDSFSVSTLLKKKVKFKNLNLLGEWPFEGMFHIIFCRNVAIYFNNETKNELWSRLSTRLYVGGEIYIGHSERIPNPEAIGLRPIGISSYKKIHIIEKYL